MNIFLHPCCLFNYLQTFFTVCLLILLFLISTNSYAAIDVLDDSGQLITLTQPAQSIISLSPGLTELVYAAGGSLKIKAAVSFSDFPQQAKKLPRVGSYNALDIEQILLINPDLIISWKSGNSTSQIEQLKRLGFNVYISEPSNFNDIPDTIKKLGKLMGTQKSAQKNANNFIRQLESLKQQYKPLNAKDKKRTFIQIWNNPVMSINNDHLISKVINFCGGKNIFSHAGSLTYTPDIESVLKHNPEIIIATGMTGTSKIWLKRWNKWPYLSAVKNKRLYSVNPDHLVRHTPRILLGIKQVCRLIQPAIE